MAVATLQYVATDACFRRKSDLFRRDATASIELLLEKLGSCRASAGSISRPKAAASVRATSARTCTLARRAPLNLCL